jgi:hypothetical protein
VELAAVFGAALAGRPRKAAPAGWWLQLRRLQSRRPDRLDGRKCARSLTVGDWLRSLVWAGVALTAPIIAATASATGRGCRASPESGPRAAAPHDAVYGRSASS